MYMMRSYIPGILESIFNKFELEYLALYRPNNINDIIAKGKPGKILPFANEPPKIVFATLSIDRLYNEGDNHKLNRGYILFSNLHLSKKISIWLETYNKICLGQPHALNAYIPIALRDLPCVKFLFASTGCDPHLLHSLRFLENRYFSNNQQ